MGEEVILVDILAILSVPSYILRSLDGSYAYAEPDHSNGQAPRGYLDGWWADAVTRQFVYN